MCRRQVASRASVYIDDHIMRPFVPALPVWIIQLEQRGVGAFKPILNYPHLGAILQK